MGSDRKHEKHKPLHDCIRGVEGLTLIEMLVAVVIGSILAIALYEVFTTQDRVYSVQDEAGELAQNLRVGMDRISRDLTLAGFGKPSWSTVNGTDLSGWYGLPNYTPLRTTTVAGNTVIDIVGCLDPPSGHLSGNYRVRIDVAHPSCGRGG